MIDSGIFQLKTVAQLFAKLLKDYELLKKEPANSEAWFNFLVTADHLPEWEFAGDEAAAARLREGEALLRVCHYLSINAKHFKVRERKKAGVVQLPAVASTNAAYVYQWDGSMPAPNPMPERLEFDIALSEREAKELGTDEMQAIELAGRLVMFWRKRLAIS